MTRADTSTRRRTKSSTKKFRRRFPMSPVSALRREDDQEPAVLVVGGEDVGDGIGGKGAPGGDGDPLSERPNPPLQRGLDRVGEPVTVGVGSLAPFAGFAPLQAEHFLHRAA